MRRLLPLVAAPFVLPACDLPEVIPDAVTRGGDRMHGLWWFSNWTALGVVVLVWVLVAVAVVRFRAGGRTDLPDQKAYNIPLEVLYTVVPLVIVGVFFAMSVIVQEDVNDTDDEPDLVVGVTGFQWGWRFTYEGEGVTVQTENERDPELVLPVGQVVRFELRTTDVIHSFWVPRFLSKRDLIPRIDNQIDVEVTEAGRWGGRCAEYCGIYHHAMNFTVRAVPSGEFDDWLEEAS
jgi:cytochrome c oxidase subunit II